MTLTPTLTSQVGADGGVVSREDLAALQARAAALSNEAVDIVGSITGAPSAASFREGFTLLAPGDVVNLRSLFRRMGLHN